ncbi:hypothetical protein FVEG_11182 [Fusarium verticillioides 7600]|uniref:Uncharacterized protein n=1 Tax=Gibberella moniliformis (strain M3125 / FGSC 7600) TaxID=334819 RepID=W7MXE9_GIBM7|nr:hypothetical protein FVEG_11182 [Fusarium verticillioides 7600]XP_018758620.1 hypothetical protein FVEG_11182 [Fusarium verticillioides 7600]XP_018758621.1 hypothetical protein FVEG_11182 [Fusarium verticillioides 7600]EWG52428.1 hypothetical protein FVEG_11182 [Fusarium verticillioides 7600]EWG52429.1 hypothetical protein FVEG_11182 [Fusarium verticillioides 7600]EWG52430.1 hypothetical protein FVEG_11182 [Fusarium verticillioides 7600]
MRELKVLARTPHVGQSNSYQSTIRVFPFRKVPYLRPSQISRTSYHQPFHNPWLNGRYIHANSGREREKKKSSLPKKGCARLKTRKDERVGMKLGIEKTDCSRRDSMHVMQRLFFTCGQDPNRSV